MGYKKRVCVGCGQEWKPRNSGQALHQNCTVCVDEAGKRALAPLQPISFKPVGHINKLIKTGSPIKVGVLDIEATGLDASFGRVLCAVIQTYGPDVTKIFRADDYPNWHKGLRADDSLLVRDILEYVDDLDVIIAHNGVFYDMPFLRTRSLIHGLPAVNPAKIIDPVLLARKEFRFHSNRLDSISNVLQTTVQKTPVSPSVWMAAIGDGSRVAMDTIVEHCVHDVEVLAEVTYRIRKYVRVIDTLGSWRK